MSRRAHRRRSGRAKKDKGSRSAESEEERISYYGSDFYHPNDKGSAYLAEELAREIGPFRKQR